MTRSRRTALITGVLFAITIVFSIPGALLYGPVLDDPDYVLGAGADGQVALGAFFEILVGVANIGTAVVLFPLLRRESEALALSYVASRIVESTIIAVGILSILSVVTLRQGVAEGTVAGSDSAVAAGAALVALHGATFLVGPGLLAGFGNGLVLGYLLYRSRLVPRPMAVLGLVAGPLVMASGILVLFGVYDQVSAWSGLATLPEFVWEAFLAVYLIVKGFRPAPPTPGDTASASPSAVSA
ncbi:DUF4386 domain-containing protein [Naasia aerilata]|uniref:DUF4386 domain-containing protein n=1 Tax=Naasia aerilata TaxID=1162966 RepID=A0ABN6XSU4_9MICO|nr:DUF4386 domain-containing protein [Naasia aerilata]BDZ46745.1 hypothetical protein GCM10025866_26540 [Naasia aerilata]